MNWLKDNMTTQVSTKFRTKLLSW